MIKKSDVEYGLKTIEKEYKESEQKFNQLPEECQLVAISTEKNLRNLSRSVKGWFHRQDY